ncbi:DUF960 family protein [Clostridium sp. LBM24168]
MFDSDRCITRRIRNYIDEEIQMEIWNIIDKFKAIPNCMDYLQMFELKEIKNTEEFNNRYNQEIIHFQRHPEYKENIFLEVDNPADIKIYVIDYSDHTIMMESSEY